MTERTAATLHLHPELPIHLTCDAPQTSSDGGALLLRQVDERLGLLSRLAACIPNKRAPSRIEHTRLEQLRQRVYQIALGDEDCNDAHQLRNDAALRNCPSSRGQGAALEPLALARAAGARPALHRE